MNRAARTSTSRERPHTVILTALSSIGETHEEASARSVLDYYFRLRSGRNTIAEYVRSAIVSIGSVEPLLDRMFDDSPFIFSDERRFLREMIVGSGALPDYLGAGLGIAELRCRVEDLPEYCEELGVRLNQHSFSIRRVAIL